MGKRIVLFADNKPGVEIAQYLRENGDEIVRLYLHTKKFRKMGPEIIRASGIRKSKIFSDEKLKDQSHHNAIKKLNPDFIITVFWRTLLPDTILQSARHGTINFHPALLPIGRGWYSHVHSIAQGLSAGVTLHQMDSGVDTGPIWAQKKIRVMEYETAKDLYDRLQKEIVSLFKNTWPKISLGKIKPKKQDSKKALYFSKKDVDKYDKLNLNEKKTVRELLNIFRARSFGDRGFAYFESSGKKIYVNIRLVPEK